MKYLTGNLGLVVFAVTVLFNVGALLLDLILLSCERKTLSEHVDTSTFLFWLFVGWQILGTLSLAYHLKLE